MNVIAIVLSLYTLILSITFVSSHPSPKELLHAGQQHAKTTTTAAYPESPPPFAQHVQNQSPAFPDLGGRSLTQNFAVSDLLLASDVEGNVHALNRETGELVWTLMGQKPLVQSYNLAAGAAAVEEEDEINEDEEITWIVEPYRDGALYFFNKNYGLQKVSTSIKDLVLQSPFALNGDDKIYTGTRKTSLYKVNTRTGEIVSSFGFAEDDSNKYDSIRPGLGLDDEEDDEFFGSDDQYLGHGHGQGHQDEGSQESITGPDPVILLGRTTYELNIYSQSANKTLWNVTYMTWGPNNLDLDLVQQNQDSVDGVYIAPFHDSSLLAIDSNSKMAKWVSNLPNGGVAIDVFDIFQDLQSEEQGQQNTYLLLPHPMRPNMMGIPNNGDQTDSDTDKVTAETYIDTTLQGSWFAMSGANYPSLVKSAPVAKYCLSDRWRRSSIFKDDNLLYKSIQGVHKNYAGQTLSLELAKNIIPSAVGGRIMNTNTQQNNIPKATDPAAAAAAAIAERSWLSLPTADILSIDPPHPYTTYSLTRVLFRLFENTITTFLLLLLIVGLSRIGVLPPITQILSKFGFFKRTHHAVELVDQLMKGDETSINLIKKERQKKYVNGQLVNNNTTHNNELNNNDKNNDNENDDEEQEHEEVGKEEEEDDEGEIDTELQNKIDNIEENKRFTKKVTILEPEPEQDQNTTQQQQQPMKKTRKRGSRGGKKKKKNQEVNNNSDESSIITTSSGNTAAATGTTGATVTANTEIKNNLVLSDVVLGYGSHGTVVYKGTFENRPVAIKRMLIDFYDVASQEVKLLQESDDHPNVIRYFCSQEHDRFLYIALELCSATLEDVIDSNSEYQGLLNNRMNVVDALYQITNGLQHLHNLKIVHRDIKPQNILVVPPKRGHGPHHSQTDSNNVRMLISDFGLCKKLEADQSSFRATTAQAAGTSGWRAPELLQLCCTSNNNNGTTNDEMTQDSIESEVPVVQYDTITHKRLTKAIDIFSMGCVFYYMLSGGQHPFGDRYLREGNIIKGAYDLEALEIMPDAFESKDLISKMIAKDAMERPDTGQILRHPFFWKVEKKLDFLLKVSDRFEIERRDPPSDLLLRLEAIAPTVVGGNGTKGWYQKFDQEFLDNLGKYRKYDALKLMDLLRALRNKYHHFNDMNSSLQHKMGPIPQGFYDYYIDKFPNLLMEIYYVIVENLQHEEIFKPFF